MSWAHPIDWPGVVGSADAPRLGVTSIPLAQAPTAFGDREVYGVWGFAPFETGLDSKDHPNFSVVLPFEAADEGAIDTSTVSWHVAHYDVDIITELMGEVDASYEVISDTTFATVDVPVLSLIVAVGPEPSGDDNDSAGDDDDSSSSEGQ